MNRVFLSALAVAALAVAACDGGSGETKTIQLTPASPSGTPSGSSALTAPTADSPAENGQLSTVRPTLTVRNSTSSQSGTWVYEFQESDNVNFTASSWAASAYYAVAVNRTGVPEDASGRTSYTVETELQPATKLYWRARSTQGATTSAWSGNPSGCRRRSAAWDSWRWTRPAASPGTRPSSGRGCVGTSIRSSVQLPISSCRMRL